MLIVPKKSRGTIKKAYDYVVKTCGEIMEGKIELKKCCVQDSQKVC